MPGFQMVRPVHLKGDRVRETSKPSYVGWSRRRAPVRADSRRQVISQQTSQDFVKIPEDLDWDSAAALPVAPLSAWYCLQRLARLRSGEKVLIWAAASGVGDAAVQIAKHLGATVIATAGSDEKVTWALEHGADEGINHAREDVLERTRAIAGEEGVEVVLDTVGGSIFSESLKVVGHGGRVVALANVGLEQSRIDTRDFYPKNVTIYG